MIFDIGKRQAGDSPELGAAAPASESQAGAPGWARARGALTGRLNLKITSGDQ